MSVHKPSSPLGDALRIFVRNKPALISLLMISVLAISAITGAIFTGDEAQPADLVRIEEAALLGDYYDTNVNPTAVAHPGKTELKDTFLSPFSKSREHKDKTYWLGTDDLGRDVAARLWAGSSISLTIGFLAVGISVLLGITLGGIAGYFGRERVGISVIAALLFFLAGGILLATDIVGPGWALIGCGGAIVLGMLGIAVAGGRYKTAGFFVVTLALAASLLLYNRSIETGTPEGAVYTEARKTHEAAYEQLLALRDYGRAVKAWEDERPENVLNLPERKDLPEWLYSGQLDVEIGMALLELQEQRFNVQKYESALTEAERLHAEQQTRAEYQKGFEAEYKSRHEESVLKVAQLLAQRDELFKAGDREAGRKAAADADNEQLRANTFDPVTMVKRATQLHETAVARHAYITALIAGIADALAARRKAIETAAEGLEAIRAKGATNAAQLRERQYEFETVKRTLKLADDDFNLADNAQRRAAIEAALKGLADAKPEHAGVANLKGELQGLQGRVEALEAARKKTEESVTALGKYQKEEAQGGEAAKGVERAFAPLPIQGSNGLVDRRGKMRKAFVIKYDTELRNGLTSLRIAKQLDGNYRYGFYRFSSHFLTITALALLLSVATLMVMASAQGVALDKFKALKPAFLPTISVDDLVMRFTEIMLTVPVIFLILAILAIFEKDVFITMGVIGLTSWMGTTRFVRAEILSLREQDFVQSAKALGMSDFRIIWRHLVPNAISPVLVSATLGVAGAVLAESTLSFLGIGAKPEQTTWGMILSQGREYIFDAPWLTWIPGLAILFTVLSFNLLGEGLREAFNPKLRGR